MILWDEKKDKDKNKQDASSDTTVKSSGCFVISQCSDHVLHLEWLSQLFRCSSSPLDCSRRSSVNLTSSLANSSVILSNPSKLARCQTSRSMMSKNSNRISWGHAINLRQIDSPVHFLGSTLLNTTFVSFSRATRKVNVFPSFSFPMNGCPSGTRGSIPVALRQSASRPLPLMQLSTSSRKKNASSRAGFLLDHLACKEHVCFPLEKLVLCLAIVKPFAFVGLASFLYQVIPCWSHGLHVAPSRRSSRQPLETIVTSCATDPVTVFNCTTNTPVFPTSESFENPIDPFSVP